MAQALGVSFKDDNGEEIGDGGGKLSRIQDIDIIGIEPRLKNARITILSDVANPLCGPDLIIMLGTSSFNLLTRGLKKNLQRRQRLLPAL